MINRKTVKIDAANKSVGRLASQIALILRGKNKPEFEPHLDLGDKVSIINIDKLSFSGKKLEQKKYFKYSGYPGGLKTLKLADIYKKNPAEVLLRAVKQMLPGNKLRNNMLKRLDIK